MIKILMITSSSEGITLKNTRFVHLIELIGILLEQIKLLDALDVFVVMIYLKN